MARINIEKKLFERGEWMALLIKTGSADAAMGALVRAWMVAQRYWFPNKSLIPREVWNREGLNQAVIDCGLAEELDSGIRLRGTEEQFSWLFEASEKGKKSAESRKKKNGTAQPSGKKRQKSQKNIEHSSNTVQPDLNSAEAPYSLLSSPISLLSSQNSILNSHIVSEGVNKPPSAPIEISANSACWNAYEEAYRKRYGVDPVRNAQTNAQIANFVKKVPAEEAPAIAAFFVQHNKPWYVGRSHDVGDLLKDASGLRTQWKTNRKVTTTDAKNAEFGDSLKNQLQRLGGAS